MISQIINRVEKTYEQYLNVKTFVTGVLNGEFTLSKKNIDQDFTKRFEKESKESTPAKDFTNAKIESMTHSQGVGNFSGSGYQTAGSVIHDKVVHNKPRHH